MTDCSAHAESNKAYSFALAAILMRQPHDAFETGLHHQNLSGINESDFFRLECD
jgi:hypothetical protein